MFVLIKKIIFPIVALCVANHLSAEPSAFVKSLMSQPVSMWDLGMMRLKMHINSAFEGKARVIYSWEKNVIYIQLISDKTANDKTLGKELCEQQLEKLRKHFFFNTKMMNMGDLLSDYRTVGSNASLYSIFNHEFYETSGRGLNMKKEINKIISLRGMSTVFFDKNTSYLFTCDGSVAGSEITFEELKL